MQSGPSLPQDTLTPPAPSGGKQGAGPAITHSRLENGLQIVVIPDHRTPVVTHMIWYQNGSADDPPGKSGIAHFLEHLMFKGTKAHPKGFSDLVAELGGQENAFTAYDYTAYFQRVAKEHLATMMGFEADRMMGLVLTDDVVAPERDVVLEERRMRTDSDPAQQLNEAVQASLFPHHPYGTPVIGWGHEIETLDRSDALTYYERFYTPANAILIVAGDVETSEVERLARETYGRIRGREKPPRRFRPQEPEPRAHRLVTLADPKVEQPAHERVFMVPSYTTGAPGEAEALEVLTHFLGGGHTSLFYRELVIARKLAVAVGAYYMGTSLDATRLWIYAMPTPATSLEALDRALDEVIARVADHPIDEADLNRARTRLVADAIYAQDNQASLARWYGASLATGLTIDDITRWPERLEAVSADAVQKAARKWLDKRRAVTGFLLPEAAA
jgi:zinc protease